jgi:hypothetical protein
VVESIPGCPGRLKPKLQVEKIHSRANAPMAGAKKSLFCARMFRELELQQMKALRFRQRMAGLPSRLRSWHIRIVRSLSKSIQDCLGNAAQETTGEGPCKMPMRISSCLLPASCIWKGRIRDSCHFTILRSKYAQMQVDISTLRAWPQITVLIIGNRLYHASRNKLIPFCTRWRLSTSVSRNTGSCSSEL